MSCRNDGAISWYQPRRCPRGPLGLRVGAPLNGIICRVLTIEAFLWRLDFSGQISINLNIYLHAGESLDHLSKPATWLCIQGREKANVHFRIQSCVHDGNVKQFLLEMSSVPSLL